MNDPKRLPGGDFSVDRRLLRNYAGYYDDGQSEWRRLGAIDKADNIARLSGSSPHATVLEIGAGEGSVVQRLSETGFGDTLHALEISESGVEAIRARQIERLVDVRLFDGYTLPYERKQFDLAILSHVLEHVEYPRRLLHEAVRVARLVFIEVPLEDTFRLTGDFVPDAVGHINFYSMKTFRRLIQTCGLEILQQRVSNPGRGVYEFRLGKRGLVTYWIKQLTSRVTPRLASAVWTYHGSLLCRDPAE